MDYRRAQKSHIIYDTSFWVNYGMNDLGVMLAQANLKRRLAERGEYLEIVPNQGIDEYTNLFERAIENKIQTPKASIDVLSYLHNRFKAVDTPDEVDSSTLRKKTRQLREEARQLWYKSSRKALLGRGISTTDLGLIMYTKTLAERGDAAFVFSFDEDIIGPVSELEESGKDVHPITYTKEDNVSILCDDKPTIFLTEDALSQLYNIPLTRFAYMLSAKLSIGDVKCPVVWKIGTNFTDRKLEEGVVRRFPMDIVEFGDIPNLKEKNYIYSAEDIRQQTNGAYLNQTLQSRYLLNRMYQQWRYFIVLRNKRMGWFSMAFFDGGRKIKMPSGPQVHSVRCFMLPDHYLTGYHFDWYKHLGDLRLAYKE